METAAKHRNATSTIQNTGSVAQACPGASAAGRRAHHVTTTNATPVIASTIA